MYWFKDKEIGCVGFSNAPPLKRLRVYRRDLSVLPGICIFTLRCALIGNKQDKDIGENTAQDYIIYVKLLLIL